MNCKELRRTLGLEDLDMQPDPKAMSQHLAECSHCRSEFGEIAGLYGLDAPSTELPKVQSRQPSKSQPWRRAAAVAALLIACTWAGLAVWNMDSSTNSSDPAQGARHESTSETTAAAARRLRYEELNRREALMASDEEQTTTISRVEDGRVVQVTIRHGRVLHGLTPNWRNSP